MFCLIFRSHRRSIGSPFLEYAIRFNGVSLHRCELRLSEVKFTRAASCNVHYVFLTFGDSSVYDSHDQQQQLSPYALNKKRRAYTEKSGTSRMIAMSRSRKVWKPVLYPGTVVLSGVSWDNTRIYSILPTDMLRILATDFSRSIDPEPFRHVIKVPQ